MRSAQGKVLGALFGVGTDITVTTATAPASGSAGLTQITPEPYVQQSDTLASPTQGTLKASTVAAIARLHDVSAADVGTVMGEISKLLPSATVTNSASLASGVAGSLKTTAQLARSLGIWLAVLALLAAVAVASLLTLAAVARTDVRQPERHPYRRRILHRPGHGRRDRAGRGPGDRRGAGRRVVRRLADQPAAPGRSPRQGGVREIRPCTR